MRELAPTERKMEAWADTTWSYTVERRLQSTIRRPSNKGMVRTVQYGLTAFEWRACEAFVRRQHRHLSDAESRGQAVRGPWFAARTLRTSTISLIMLAGCCAVKCSIGEGGCGIQKHVLKIHTPLWNNFAASASTGGSIQPKGTLTEPRSIQQESFRACHSIRKAILPPLAQKAKTIDNQDSLMVTHLTTNRSAQCLSCLSGREGLFSLSCGRLRKDT